MRFPRVLRRFGLLRRTLKVLDRIDARLAEQNRYLCRLADHFAPVPPEAGDVVTHSSISFLNQNEAGRVQDYIDRVQSDQGRAPTEEEILAHLAAEETTALHDGWSEVRE